MWLEIQIFGFRALWSPYFLAFVLLVSLLYYLFTGPYRHVFGNVERATINEQLFFYSGMLVIYIAQGSPVDLKRFLYLLQVYLLLYLFFIVYLHCFRYQLYLIFQNHHSLFMNQLKYSY